MSATPRVIEVLPIANYSAVILSGFKPDRESECTRSVRERHRSPSALVLATARLGGLVAITVENAMEETRRRVLELLNADRIQIDFARTNQAIAFVRGAVTVHPWLTPPRSLWPENQEDAYLLEAVRVHRPSCLLTLDEEVRQLFDFEGTKILRPGELLALPDLGGDG